VKKILIFLVIIYTLSSYDETHLNIVLDGKNCENCDLSNAKLNNRNFKGFLLNGTNFQNSNISNCNFIGAQLKNSNLSGAKANNTDFSSALLENSKAHNGNFSGTKFINSISKFTEWKGSNLNNANFLYADLSNSNFQDSDITGAIFKNSNLYFADLNVKKGGETLTLLNQDLNMPLGIMYLPIKYCCTNTPDGKLTIYNDPAVCTQKDIEACKKIAQEKNLKIETIEPY
jgi:hypothetical protein